MAWLGLASFSLSLNVSGLDFRLRVYGTSAGALQRLKSFLHGGLHRVPCAGAQSQGTAGPRRMVGGDSKPLLPPGGLGLGFRV